MSTKTRTSWILALIGTILVWFPIAAMIFTSTAGSIRSGQYRMDYLIPAELFPSVLVGGILLIWAVFRCKILKLPVTLTFAVVFVLLIGSQVLALTTGLANGTIGLDNRWFTVVSTMLGLYDLAAAILGVFGVLLLVRLKNSAAAG